MKCCINPIIHVLTALLCTGAAGVGTAGGDTLVLPRKNKEAPAIQHYDIVAFKAEDKKLVAERLEHLFLVWELLATEFWAESLKEERTEPIPTRHKVVLYRNKREYADHLRRIDPFIDRSNGFYDASGRTAYFFSPETRVLFHEGTHQILAEHYFRNKAPAFHNNFWITEGIALFMQTLKVEEKCYKIGDILDDRLFSAKVRLFGQNYNLPIRKLTAMTAKEIQSSADIDKIYSQSAALVHWLMFAEEGRYRRSLFELLRRTYLDTAKPDSLSKLTGLSYEELDVNYAEFLKTIPDERENKD